MKGSCVCKAVSYEVDGFSGPIGHCHCHTCRKAHAAAFTSTARADRDFRIDEARQWRAPRQM
jgi:hypothetical protein